MSSIILVQSVNANLKVYGRLGYMKNQKKKNPAMKIAMCGCMMQEPTVVEKIQKSYPFVDLVFGTHNVYKLAELLYTRIHSDRMVLDIWKEAEGIVEDLPSVRKYPFKAGVNIMYGCNNFCTYCIVPYVRGRERSRKPEEILREIKNLVADGVIEIMLLGQNVNSYGKTLEEPMTFAELLQEVEKIEGLERIRFMTSHPKDLSDELIEVMAKSKKICTHLHLPLQSGSTEILKKMNRHYTKEQYLDLVVRIKEKMPNISLTTDLIVGFPGETVKERFARLLDVIHEISKEITDAKEGEIVEALMEEVNDHDENLITGRLSSNAVVHCPGDKSLIGKICKVKLTESKGFYFMGEIQ